jgi:hypothetical protein
VSGNPFAEPGDKLSDHQVIVTRRFEAAAGQVASARKLEVRMIDSGSTGKPATPAEDERGQEEIEPLATGEE